MRFLSTISLIALALISLPVIIHLLARRNARRLDFPSLRFLRETPSFRLRPRRVREPLLLALRVAALLLLIMGLARPLITSRASGKRNRVVLIDASLSMRARGRTHAAREQARNIINKLGAGERAAILACTNRCSLLAPLTADRNILSKALEQYQPLSGSASYAAAVEEADRILSQEQQMTGEIDLISDFQLSEIAGAQPPYKTSAAIVAYPTGAQIERNAFLTDEEAARTERGNEISATEIVEGEDGRRGARARWAMEQAAGSTSAIEWRTEGNGQVTGRLSATEADDFDADDESYFAFTPPRERRVLLIESDTDSKLFLRAALESALDVSGASPTELSAVRELPRSSDELKRFSLVVVTFGGEPAAEDIKILSEYARAGGTVWMMLARDLNTQSWNAFASAEQAQALPFVGLARFVNQSRKIVMVDEGSRELRHLDESSSSALRAVDVHDSFTLTAREGASVLIRWSDNSVACASSRIGDGAILATGFSPDRASGNLGLSPALPALVSSILRSSAEARSPLARTIGEPLVLNLAPEEDVAVTDAKGGKISAKARELMAQPENFFVEPGIFRLETRDGAVQFLAFNPPASESERELATPEQVKNYLESASAPEPQVKTESLADNLEREQSAWRYFLTAAFLLLVAELFYAQSLRRKRSVLTEIPGEEV